MFDSLDSLVSLITNEIIMPIYNVLMASDAFPNLLLAIGSFITFLLNIFCEIPVVEILDSNGSVVIDLFGFFDIDTLASIVSELIGLLIIIWLLKIFFRFIKFIIDLVLILVKDLQREIKMNYYLKNKKEVINNYDKKIKKFIWKNIFKII